VCVRNSVIDEKEDACLALGEIAIHSSVAFLPFMDTCFPEVLKLSECFFLRVRKGAFYCLGQFCISLHQVCEQDPSEPNSAALQKMLSVVLPDYINGIREDTERQVVTEILEILTKLLKACKQEALREQGRLAELCRVIRMVLEKK
ncbi:UNVERIFIED_CONTAM: hypothetical protein K2H54_042890, partial [Gekko kuhli]